MSLKSYGRSEKQLRACPCGFSSRGVRRAPGTTVVAVIQPAAFSGTAIIQGSDDNSTWSTLKTSGSLTTDSEMQLAEVTLPKYVRHNTTRSAGSVSMYILNAG